MIIDRGAMLMKIAHACDKFLEEHKGPSACIDCPIYKKGLCNKIFNQGNCTDGELEMAIVMMCGNVVSDVDNSNLSAWDIVRGMSEEEYEYFKEFLYDKYASMCSLEDLISNFTNDELIEKYREFKM